LKLCSEKLQWEQFWNCAVKAAVGTVLELCSKKQEVRQLRNHDVKLGNENSLGTMQQKAAVGTVLELCSKKQEVRQWRNHDAKLGNENSLGTMQQKAEV